MLDLRTGDILAETTQKSYLATRNRTRDHLLAAAFYSQTLYQLSYSRRCQFLSQLKNAANPNKASGIYLLRCCRVSDIRFLKSISMFGSLSSVVRAMVL